MISQRVFAVALVFLSIGFVWTLDKGGMWAVYAPFLMGGALGSLSISPFMIKKLRLFWGKRNGKANPYY